MEKHQLPLSSSPTAPKHRPSPLTYTLLFLSLIALGFQLVAQLPPRFSFSHCTKSNDTLHWKPCGDGMRCTKLSVPLNWENQTDQRRVELSILKRPASNQREKLGSLYINPGGPGGSGSYIESAGWFFDKLLNGRYDLISWDPRGVNQTSDHVTCFSSSLSQHLYHVTSPTSLSLPSNLSSLNAENTSDPHAVFRDLERQVGLAESSLKAMYEGCKKRTGDSLAFVGTKSVVRDLEAISRAVDGREGRINFWGMSYGTVIGQYMTSLLPPHRLGKIVLDGVVNATMWTGPWDRTHPYSSLRDISPIYTTFATSCLSSPSSCALSHLNSTSSIFASISSLLDTVYHKPIPLPGVEGNPGMVVQARHVRQALFRGAYSIKEWPAMASKLAKAMRGDRSDLVQGTLPVLEGGWEGADKRPDPSSNQATVAIRCADASPFLRHPTEPPTPHSLATDLLLSHRLNSPYVGDQFFDLSFCHSWPIESQSYYDYTATAGEQEQLDTPVLVLNQRHDPVTPIGAAELVLERLGRSARLVQQNGDGHCVIGQASLCTAKIIRAYLLRDQLPSESHTVCEVDEHGFSTSPDIEEEEERKLSALSIEERSLLEAWRGAEGLVL